jgi:hypothetical protein
MVDRRRRSKRLAFVHGGTRDGGQRKGGLEPIQLETLYIAQSVGWIGRLDGPARRAGLG